MTDQQLEQAGDHSVTTHFISAEEALHSPRSCVDSVPQKICSPVSHWFARINAEVLWYFQRN